MKIEILGTGCTKCKMLYEAVQTAVKEKGIEAEIVKNLDSLLSPAKKAPRKKS